MQLTTTNQSARIDLKQGAALTELILEARGKPVTLISSAQQYLYASSLLFPFPNRLKNGTYDINGSTYAFPLNDFGRPNALHGFIHDKEFHIVSKDGPELRAGYDYDGSLSYYPFSFTFGVTYKLQPSALEIIVEITNTSDGPMPFGLGWHPYFNVPAANTSMKLPNVHRYDLDDNFIPTGASENFETFAEHKILDGISLDDSFRITGSKFSSFLRFNDGTTVEIWQDPQFNYLQIYTPDDRQSVAIEPMTCGVNAWNMDDEIPILGKGETFRGSFGVKVY